MIEGRGLGEFLAGLADEVRAGTYRPMPYRRREIPKEGNKVRVISIPAIRDRVVQGALRLILEPIFEADFSDSSFGARPRRSAHDAVEKVRMGLRQRKHRVVDVDLSRYFDNLRHDRMLAKMAKRVFDAKVLAMLRQFLKSTGERGVPQGSPLSPLVANLALNDLDHALDRGGDFITYARYLDDNHQDGPYSYQAEGDTYFDEERDRLIGDRHLVLFGDGDAVVVSAGEEPLRFLLISGKPIGEPIAWRGPIVMNTQAELRVAFDELDRGTFIKHSSGSS
jgi:group II intron reverse transcriptase/maturase